MLYILWGIVMIGTLVVQILILREHVKTWIYFKKKQESPTQKEDERAEENEKEIEEFIDCYMEESERNFQKSKDL